MKLIVPDAIRHAIKDADMANFAETRRKVIERDRERKRLEKIVRLREENRQDLLGFAEFVFEWREAFAGTEEAKRIWELIGPDVALTVFGARFFRGEPTDDPHCWATLSLGGWHPDRQGLPPFWYEERYNSSQGSAALKETAGSADDAERLIDRVHPDFLEKCYKHLCGPDAWTFILGQIKKLSEKK